MFAFIYFFWLQFSVFCATLSIGTVRLSEGEKSGSIPVDIQLGAGEKVSGLQFDIVVPSGIVIKGVEEGESAKKSAKMATYNKISASTYRVIVAGLNRNIMEDGTVVIVKFEITNTTTDKLSMKLSDVVLADPDGNPVLCMVQTGYILIGEDEQSVRVLPSGEKPSQNSTNEKNKSSIVLWFFVLIGGVVISLLIYYLLRKRRKDSIGLQTTSLHKRKSSKPKKSK